jgi:hypothetical protein
VGKTDPFDVLDKKADEIATGPGSITGIAPGQATPPPPEDTPPEEPPKEPPKEPVLPTPAPEAPKKPDVEPAKPKEVTPPVAQPREAGIQPELARAVHESFGSPGWFTMQGVYRVDDPRYGVYWVWKSRDKWYARTPSGETQVYSGVPIARDAEVYLTNLFVNPVDKNFSGKLVNPIDPKDKYPFVPLALTDVSALGPTEKGFVVTPTGTGIIEGGPSTVPEEPKKDDDLVKLEQFRGEQSKKHERALTAAAAETTLAGVFSTYVNEMFPDLDPQQHTNLVAEIRDAVDGTLRSVAMYMVTDNLSFSDALRTVLAGRLGVEDDLYTTMTTASAQDLLRTVLGMKGSNALNDLMVHLQYHLSSIESIRGTEVGRRAQVILQKLEDKLPGISKLLSAQTKAIDGGAVSLVEKAYESWIRSGGAGTFDDFVNQIESLDSVVDQFTAKMKKEWEINVAPLRDAVLESLRRRGAKLELYELTPDADAEAKAVIENLAEEALQAGITNPKDVENFIEGLDPVLKAAVNAFVSKRISEDQTLEALNKATGDFAKRFGLDENEARGLLLDQAGNIQSAARDAGFAGRENEWLKKELAKGEDANIIVKVLVDTAKTQARRKTLNDRVASSAPVIVGDMVGSLKGIKDDEQEGFENLAAMVYERHRSEIAKAMQEDKFEGTAAEWILKNRNDSRVQAMYADFKSQAESRLEKLKSMADRSILKQEGSARVIVQAAVGEAGAGTLVIPEIVNTKFPVIWQAFISSGEDNFAAWWEGSELLQKDLEEYSKAMQELNEADEAKRAIAERNVERASGVIDARLTVSSLAQSWYEDPSDVFEVVRRADDLYDMWDAMGKQGTFEEFVQNLGKEFFDNLINPPRRRGGVSAGGGGGRRGRATPSKWRRGRV